VCIVVVMILDLFIGSITHYGEYACSVRSQAERRQITSIWNIRVRVQLQLPTIGVIRTRTQYCYSIVSLQSLAYHPYCLNMEYELNYAAKISASPAIN